MAFFKSAKSGRRKLGMIAVIAAVLVVNGCLLVQSSNAQSDSEETASDSPWRTEFIQGLKLWKQDKNKSKELINKAINEPLVPKAQRMSLYRGYAALLWHDQDTKEAFEQLEKSIALSNGDPPAQSLEALELTKAYQDIGSWHHELYLRNPKLPSGADDLLKAVATAEKALGAQSLPAMCAYATLGEFYGDSGDTDKSKVFFDRALAVLKSNEKSSSAAWYVYAMLARSSAAQHHDEDAINYYLQSIHSTSDRKHREQARQEFMAGLSLHQPSPDSRLAKEPAMLSAGDFKELEQLAEEYRKSHASKPYGEWAIDTFYHSLFGDTFITPSRRSDSRFTEQISALRSWLKQYPDSATARVALAQCLTDYGWQARGCGYADSVSQGDFRQFESRLQQAKVILDGDPTIKEKCPRAYAVYGQLAVGLSMKKADLMKMVDECHKKWPGYRSIDMQACTYLLPQWYGEGDEWVEFAAHISDQIGGLEGDEAYAQLVHSQALHFRNILKECPSIDWQRFVRGCKKVISDFPDRLTAKVMLFDFARLKNDEDAMKTAFVQK